MRQYLRTTHMTRILRNLEDLLYFYLAHIGHRYVIALSLLSVDIRRGSVQ